MNKLDLVLESETSSTELRFSHAEIHFESWLDLKSYLLSVHEEPYKWIFRGMADSNNVLKTSLERHVQEKRRISYAGIIIGEFMCNAHNYLDPPEIPKEHELLEWLSLMQHHGAPTNLLDWTYSPYIACYFAVEEIPIEKQVDDNLACIWILNETLILQLCKDYFINHGLDLGNRTHPKRLNEPQYFTQIFKLAYSKKGDGFILPISPRKRNLRLLSQQGTFTFVGKPDLDFSGNLSTLIDIANENALKIDTSSDLIIRKLCFPYSIIDEIRADLFLMNITARTLFPGIDGYAKSIRQHISKMDHQLASNRWEDFITGFELRD